MRSPGRTFHALAALLMAAYVVAVLAGKVAAATGKPNPLALGDVGEFLVVLASIALFVTGILATPARADNKGGDPR
jgi:hypothetical protein